MAKSSRSVYIDDMKFKNEISKRAFDVIASLGALVVTAPITVPVAVAIRATMGSPVLFRHTRPGKNGEPFEMLKFRTMRNLRPGEDMLATDGDRITPLGKFLRQTSIDELPEFLNVLRGDMSVVGPRPLLMQYLPRYNATQARRHDVRPGITGWTQVNGRNNLSWEEKFDLDVWYVENQSLLLDLQIVAKTVVTVLKRDGISAEGMATMYEFMGTESEA